MDKAAGMMGGLYDFLKRVDAERRALMVTQISEPLFVTSLLAVCVWALKAQPT